MRVNITQCDLQGQKKTWVFCFALVEHFLRGKPGSYKKSYFPKPATWRECLKKEMPGQSHLSLLSSGTRHVNKEAILDIPAPVVWCIEESRNPFDSHNQVSRSIHLSPSVKHSTRCPQSLWIRDILLLLGSAQFPDSQNCEQNKVVASATVCCGGLLGRRLK